MNSKLLSSDGTLLKVQAGSGTVFSTFLTLHLVNAASATFGHLLYDGVLEVFRMYYQNPIVEPILFGSLFVHMGASIIRYIRRQKRLANQETSSSQQSLWDRLSPLVVHRNTGAFLALVITGHVAATRVLPPLYNVPVDFSILSFPLEYLPSAFYPYYIALGCSGLYHMSYGLLQSAKLADVKVPAILSTRGKTFWTFIGIGSLALTAAVFSFGGWFGDIPRENFPLHQNMYNQAIPFLKEYFPWNK